MLRITRLTMAKVFLFCIYYLGRPYLKRIQTSYLARLSTCSKPAFMWDIQQGSLVKSAYTILNGTMACIRGSVVVLWFPGQCSDAAQDVCSEVYSDEGPEEPG